MVADSSEHSILKNMTQYDFEKILEKYLRGECSPEEQLLLDEWSGRQMNEETTTLSEEEAKTMQRQIWKRIQHTNALGKPNLFQWFSTHRRWIVAASLLPFFFIGIWLYCVHFSSSFDTKNPDTGTDSASIEVNNTTAIPQNIKLKDGSTVVLQPGSTLAYPTFFGDTTRSVYLKGEGFFDIARDETKPFYVYAGNLVTEVLGTRFTVKSFDKAKTAEVAVLSGKVKVYALGAMADRQRKIAVLTSNQKVVFDKARRQLEARMADHPMVINPPKTPATMVFRESLLPEVLKKIEMEYEIHISLANNALSKCLFSGDLNDLELYTQLAMICKTIDAEYEIQGTSIMVSGNGCD